MAIVLLFAGSTEKPAKGFDTFRGVFSSIPDAKDWYEKNESKEVLEWGQIVDRDTMTIILNYKFVRMWKAV